MYVGLAFVLGCFAAPAAQQLVARPVQAAPEGTRKWEQYCSYFQQPASGISAHEMADQLTPELKNRGLEGWELVTVTIAPGNFAGYAYCFKRPIL
jgi:hypothetical protein